MEFHKKQRQILKTIQTLSAAGEVSKLEHLVYIINPNKASIQDVKKAFKELFEAKGDEIFEAMNSSLKQDLDLLSIDDLSGSKLDEILNVIIKSE